jgi:nucleoside 2-deoxyribosyltransferase
VRIYVATHTDNMMAAREVMQALTVRGHTITYDWTVDVERFGGMAVPERGITENQRATIARHDMEGVFSAERVWALMYKGLCGTLMECGMACAWGRPLWLIGEPERNTVFFALPNVSKFSTVPDAFSRLQAIERGIHV